MDTYNDTKNAEYKTPQNKTSKVAFLFFLRELKRMIKIIINDTKLHATLQKIHRSPNDPPYIIIIINQSINHHHHQSYHDPKKNFITIQSINHQKKKFSTKNSSNHQGYTDQKK